MSEAIDTFWAMDTCLDDDITTAIRYAQGLGEQASPERITALTGLLVEGLGASAQRLHGVRQALAQPGSVGLWDADAIRLVDSGLALLHAAGVTTAEAQGAFAARLRAEHHPEPQPFAWNRGRRRNPGLVASAGLAGAGQCEGRNQLPQWGYAASDHAYRTDAGG